MSTDNDEMNLLQSVENRFYSFREKIKTVEEGNVIDFPFNKRSNLTLAA